MTHRTWHGLILSALGTLAVVAASLGVAAPANAKKTRVPLLSMSFAKHDAWETMNDYAQTQVQQWTGGVDEKRYSCKRIRRSVVDCKTSMLFWERQEGCVESGSVGYPDYGPEFDSPDRPCPAGSRWGGWWDGERHSWTMRYRAGQAVYTIHIERYFPGDRYGTNDPTDPKFGGIALRKTAEEGT